MTAAGGLILAVVCIGTVGLCAALAAVTLGTTEPPHWIVTVVRALAIAIAGGSLLIAALHQLATAVVP